MGNSRRSMGRQFDTTEDTGRLFSARLEGAYYGEEEESTLREGIWYRILPFSEKEKGALRWAL